MKQILSICVLLFLAAAALVGGFMLWQRRPGRIVISVNGHAITAQELAWRGQTLLNDAKRDQHLAVPPEREEEALDHFKRSAARFWTIKEILLAAAVARGIAVTPNDEKEAMASAEQRLKRVRGITLNQYFDEGPLPRDIKERDFREGVLVNKFKKIEVSDKIKVTGKDIKSRTDELTRLNLMTTGPGKKPKFKTDHKSVVNLIRYEREQAGFRDLLKSLYTTAAVVSPEYPELERVEDLMAAYEGKKGAVRR